MYNIMVVDHNNRGIPVCSFFTENNDGSTVAAGLAAFQALVQGVLLSSYDPTVAMLDDAKAEYLAVKRVWPSARCALCAWHASRYRMVFV
jgi:hypothetical protein